MNFSSHGANGNVESSYDPVSQSMRMSELHHKGHSFSQSASGMGTGDAEFTAQLSSRNAEIEATRFDIQHLMVKAHAFCTNTGLGVSNNRLSNTPARYSSGVSYGEIDFSSSLGSKMP